MTTQTSPTGSETKNATVTRFLLLALLWGSSFAFIKVSLEGLTPGQLVLSRLVLGASVLLAIARLRNVALPRWGGIWGHVAAAALFGNVVPFLLLSYGEQTTGAGIAGVLVGSTPLLTLTLATAVLPAERATPRKAVGLLFGFVGLMLVIGPWRDSLGSVGGQLACLGTALSYAAGFVYVRKYLSPRGLAPLSLAASQLAAAAALQALVTPFLSWHTPHFTGRVTGSIVFLGLLSTGLAYVLYFRLIGDVGATTASAVNYMVPVFAVLISVVLLGEPVTWNLLVGGLVVLISMAYAEDRIRQLRRAPADPTPPITPPPANQADDTNKANDRLAADPTGGRRVRGPEAHSRSHGQTPAASREPAGSGPTARSAGGQFPGAVPASDT